MQRGVVRAKLMQLVQYVERESLAPASPVDEQLGQVVRQGVGPRPECCEHIRDAWKLLGERDWIAVERQRGEPPRCHRQQRFGGTRFPSACPILLARGRAVPLLARVGTNDVLADLVYVATRRALH